MALLTKFECGHNVVQQFVALRAGRHVVRHIPRALGVQKVEAVAALACISEDAVLVQQKLADLVPKLAVLCSLA